MERNLLIVDDELEIVSWLEEMFRYDFDREIGVYTARSGKAALELLNRVRFDVVLTDIHMPQMDGITLFHKVKENWPRCKTVFLTGYQNFDDVYSVFQHRDVRYVLKSERDEVIKKAVSDAFADLEAQLEEERVRRLEKEKLEKLISETEAEISEKEALMCRPETLADHKKLSELDAQVRALKTKLDEAYEKWMEM